MSISRKEAFQNAMRICSSQEKCRQDIRVKLKIWGYEGNDTEEILDELAKEKFIDESRYSAFFINDKFKLNHWGKVKIRHALKQKFIPEFIINDALKKIDLNVYIETLMALIEVKARSVKSSNKYDKKAKLIRFAQGRGFEYEFINEIVNSFIEE